ncbi:MAG TPA: hypothetical protein VHL77_10975 [Ferruginibacter sp.]|jgi:hypothetical protein|nr:hypothetical protein [Ferruginibacter sp.]
MKKFVIVLVLLCGTFISKAQDDENKKETKSGGFKKENLFTGGSATFSIGNYNTVLGASPVLGYSITNWLDAGVVFNFTYGSSRDVYYDPYTGRYFVSDDKSRQTVMGPGVFARFYPLKFLFLNVQAEHNFITDKTIYANGPTVKDKYGATSLLLGIGYAGGRQGPGDMYYYISIMGDFSGNKNSPYVGISESGKAVITPIFKAGLHIPLFQGRR